MMLSFFARSTSAGSEKIIFQVICEINGPMHFPSDVAFGPDGKVYVLDGTAELIRIYDGNGIPLSILGGSDFLKQPLGLDVNARGDILVADSGNRRLAHFLAGEKQPRYIEIPKPENGHLPDPTDVHFSQDEKAVYIVDNDNHRIIAMTLSGHLLWTRGTMGRNEGEFRFPFMIDVDGKGNLFVVEVINTRVQTLTASGNYRNFIGEWGIEPGQFYRPKGVAVNRDGIVFISDSYLGIVQAFDTGGRFIGIVGNDHGNIRRFKTPVGMDTAEDRLAVVEMINNRVLLLKKQK